MERKREEGRNHHHHHHHRPGSGPGAPSKKPTLSRPRPFVRPLGCGSSARVECGGVQPLTP
eukprot:7336274-Pyramimonas_sp.AAC.1